MGSTIIHRVLFLFFIFFLEVDARHDADNHDAEKENGERRQIGGAHLPHLKKQITDQHVK